MNAAIVRVLEQRGYFNLLPFAETNDKLETNGITLLIKCEANDESSSWNKDKMDVGRAARQKNAQAGNELSVNEQVLVVESHKEKEGLNADNVLALLDHITRNGFDRCILFTKNKLSSGAVENLDAYSTHIVFEVFRVPFRNLPDHKLVPHHRKLKPEEEEIVLKRFAVPKSYFLRILTTDPIAHYYGFPLHSLIEVTKQEDVHKQKPEYYVVCL